MIYILLLILTLAPCHLLHAMQADKLDGKTAKESRAKKHKAVTAIEVTQPSECDMLLDAYQNKRKSQYYKPDVNALNDVLDQGIEPLERALRRRDLQSCVNLIAEGHPVDHLLANHTQPIHIAAEVGMYSYCAFLIMLGKDINRSRMGNRFTTPLVIAGECGHGQLGKLLLGNGALALNTRVDEVWRVFNLLTNCQDLTLKELQQCTTILAAQRARFHMMSVSRTSCEPSVAIFRHDQEENRIFDLLALDSTRHRFLELFPQLVELGADLETPGTDGRAPLSRLAYFYFWDGSQLSPARCTKALTNIVIAYHAFLERKEVKAAVTALAIRKYHPGSLLAKIPRDPFKACVLKYIVPFRTKHVAQCVKEQLALMQRLLAIKKQYPESQSIAEIHDEDYPKLELTLALFDPASVKQHQEQLAKTTRELMGLPADNQPTSQELMSLPIAQLS